MADRGRGRGRGGGPDRGRGGPPRGRGSRGVSPSGDSGRGSSFERGRGQSPGGAPRGSSFPSPARGSGFSTPGGSRGGFDRGRGRGSGFGGRGGGGGGGGGDRRSLPPLATQAVESKIIPAQHVVSSGVKRPGFGTVGRPIELHTNCFPIQIPNVNLYQYEGFAPEAGGRGLKMDIIKAMHETPEYRSNFQKKAVYDGDKQLYSTVSFGNTRQFVVPRSDTIRKAYTVRLTQRAVINPETLHRFIQGQMSHDSSVTTALQACNIALRMELVEKHLSNRRSIFIRDARWQAFGGEYGGLEMWRGFFQSIRPAMDRMILNIDTSTGVVYKETSLIALCLQFLGQPVNNVQYLQSLSQIDKRRLGEFLRGIKFVSTQNPKGTRYIFKSLSQRTAAAYTFSKDDGTEITIERYYAEKGTRLKYPQLCCAEAVKTNNVFPLELCKVPEQLMAKKLTPDMVSDVLRFSSVRPSERLERIREGFQFLMYDQSQYVRDFGISVNPTPLRVKGRILPHPTLQYAQNQTVMPHNGAWKSKMFATPGRITGMILINMVANLPDADAIRVGNELLIACKAGGIGQPQKPPILLRRDANQTNYPKMFEEALAEHRRQRQTEANLIVFILVNQGTAAYPRIKHAGDTKLGVATQCLLMNKCVGARSDYFSNVSLKVNVKLGGVNVLPARGTSRYLGDPNNPTLFLGADVMHSKVPGEEGIGKPSFPAVVGSVDLHGAKYIGVGTAQDTREEMIQKLDESVGEIIKEFRKANPGKVPKRVVYYRDGVAENQFTTVLEVEVPQIKKAFTNSKLAVPPLTVVIVGKRHHIRWDPANDPEKDRSGNAPAGTIVDSTITSPVEFDFYLQAHAGIIGCCRAMHCNVILDENLFTPDEIQTLTFALCHVYARSTRSVSLPAPVYYAHLLCARADHRYDPDSDYHFEKSLPFSMTSAQKQEWLENSIGAFLPLHERTKQRMFFQ